MVDRHESKSVTNDFEAGRIRASGRLAREFVIPTLSCQRSKRRHMKTQLRKFGGVDQMTLDEVVSTCLELMTRGRMWHDDLVEPLAAQFAVNLMERIIKNSKFHGVSRENLLERLNAQGVNTELSEDHLRIFETSVG